MRRLISIIIPVYNNDEYLDRRFNSITSQTYKNLEIILIDDESTDNSGPICDTWANKDNRIKVIHKHHEGVAVARNCGLRIAQGEYIGFADADDWVDANMFENLTTALEQFNADIAICGFEEIGNDSRIVKVSADIHCYTKEEALRELILDRNIQSCLWNKLFRRKCIPDKPFPSLKRMSDLGGLHNFSVKQKK